MSEHQARILEILNENLEVPSAITNEYIEKILKALKIRTMIIQKGLEEGEYEVPEGDLITRGMKAAELVSSLGMTAQDIAATFQQKPNNYYPHIKKLEELKLIDVLPLRRNKAKVYLEKGFASELQRRLGVIYETFSVDELARTIKVRESREQRFASRPVGNRKRRARRTRLERQIAAAEVKLGLISGQIRMDDGIIYPANTGRVSTTKALVPFTKPSTGQTNLVSLEEVPSTLEALSAMLAEIPKEISRAMNYMYYKDSMLFGFPTGRHDDGSFDYHPVEAPDIEDIAQSPIGPLNSAEAVKLRPDRQQVLDWLEVRRDFFKEMADFVDKLMTLPCWSAIGLSTEELNTDEWPGIEPGFMPMSYLMTTRPMFEQTAIIKAAATQFMEEYRKWYEEMMKEGKIVQLYERRQARKVDEVLEELEIDSDEPESQSEELNIFHFLPPKSE